MEERQGLKIAFSQGWISDAELQQLADGLGKSNYRDYLLSLLSGR